MANMANTISSNTDVMPPGWFSVKRRSPWGGAATRTECQFLEATGKTNSVGQCALKLKLLEASNVIKMEDLLK